MRVVHKQNYFYELSLITLTSLYIGIFFNTPTFFRNMAYTENVSFTLLSTDIVFAFSACAVLLSLFSFFGLRFLKITIMCFIVISAISSYYIWFFNIVIGYGVIQAVFGTEMDLVVESVDMLLVVFICVFALLPVYFIQKHVTQKSVKQSSIPLYRSFFTRLAIFSLFVILLKTVGALYENFRGPLVDGRIPTNPIGVAAHSYVPTNWLSGSFTSVANYVVNKKLSTELENPMDQYQFYPTMPLDDVFVVFVIGESARFDHMSLMGYERNTTPLLQKEENIIGFRGESCNTSTKLSLACMFVREGGVVEKGMPLQQYVYENHVFSVLQQLGFSIDLFAMQSEVGFYGKINADMFKIREEIGAESNHLMKPVIDDLLLVDQMKDSISKRQGKHVVILHQKGSHFNYAARYPDTFSKYTPDCKNMHCDTDSMINSYDNSILYTDYFLSSLIDELRDKKVLLVYASDHGESIEDGKHFHATPKEMSPPEQLMVPVILWASDSLLEQKEFSQRFESAKNLAKNEYKVKHIEIFESLLGCLGIQADNEGIRPTNNWCFARS